MKKTLQLLVIVSLFIFAAESKAQTLLYYWSFNSLTTASVSVSPASSDSTTQGAAGTITWQLQASAPGGSTIGLMDNVAGDILNAQGSAKSVTGAANYGIRPRNPSLYAELDFSISTAGYQGIVISFECEASSIYPSAGIGKQEFDYSTDGGSTFSSTGVSVTASPSPTTGLPANEDSLTGNWALVTVDLSAATAVNNVSSLIFRIRYIGANASGTAGSSGNDRFDNVTVSGTAVTGVTNSSATDAGYSLYPNPIGSNVINLSAPTAGTKYVTVYNTTGQTVYTTTVSGQQSTLTMDNLNTGIYYVTINDNGMTYSMKFAKN